MGLGLGRVEYGYAGGGFVAVVVEGFQYALNSLAEFLAEFGVVGAKFLAEFGVVGAEFGAEFSDSFLEFGAEFGVILAGFRPLVD